MPCNVKMTDLFKVKPRIDLMKQVKVPSLISATCGTTNSGFNDKNTNKYQIGPDCSVIHLQLRLSSGLL